MQAVRNETCSAPSEWIKPPETARFQDQFNKKPFFIEHRLGEHPLFQLPRLIQLAQALPASQVEYNAGNLPISVDPQSTPRNGLSVEETIRRIEDCQSWLVLKNVETDPEYRALLDECLCPLTTLAEPLVGPVTLREAFVFVSSPGSVTPYHIDPEYNFLLQIRGSKEIQQFDGNDREVLSEQELEAFYMGAPRNLAFRDAFKTKAMTFTLTPGKGLHFPLTYPHWVKNGPEVSISFSVTFRTTASDRREVLYRMNHRIRKLGMRPTPVGKSSLRDSLLYFGFRVMRKIKRFVRPEKNPGRQAYH